MGHSRPVTGLLYHFIITIYKSKSVPRQAEVALEVPGRLSPRIISTFGTTRVVGHQPYAPAVFTPGDIPGTHFQRLSRRQGTWFCRKEPRKKIPSDNNGNRSRDRPTSSTLTTTLPQAPSWSIVLIYIIIYAAPFNRSLTLTMEALIRSRSGLSGVSYGQSGTYKRFFFDHLDFPLSVPFRRCLKHIRPSAVDDTKCYVMTASSKMMSIALL